MSHLLENKYTHIELTCSQHDAELLILNNIGLLYRPKADLCTRVNRAIL